MQPRAGLLRKSPLDPLSPLVYGFPSRRVPIFLIIVPYLLIRHLDPPLRSVYGEGSSRTKDPSTILEGILAPVLLGRPVKGPESTVGKYIDLSLFY